MRRAVLGFGLAVVWADQGLAQSVLRNDEISKDQVTITAFSRMVKLALQAAKPGHTTHYGAVAISADFDDGPYQATKSTFEIDQAVVRFG